MSGGTADEDRLCHATLAVACDIACDFAAAGGVSDMDCIPEIQVVSHRRGVSGIVGHVMSIADLAGATMAASVVSDNPVAFAEEEQHLVIPIVGRERPPMMKDDRLRVLGTPILVENFDAVFGGDESHVMLLSRYGLSSATPSRCVRPSWLMVRSAAGGPSNPIWRAENYAARLEAACAGLL
jgi:hypothetical protein